MSITAYTGLTGHGKSYGVVENVIIPALKAKRVIYTNIPMNQNICLERFGMAVIQFDMQDIKDNDNWFTDVFEAGALWVPDELWRLWPAGLKANNVLEQHKTFLAEHRHLVGENNLSTEIVFVTQDLSQIAAFARALIDNTYLVKKLSSVGLSKNYRVDVYYGAVTGATPPVSKREKEIFGKFKKSTFEVYKSHTKSLTGEAGNETRIDGRFNVLSGWKVQLFIASFIGLLVFLYFSVDSIFAPPAAMKNQPTKHPETIQEKSEYIAMQHRQTLEQTENLKAEKLKAEKLKTDFLSAFNDIEIIFNLGVYPKIDFIFGLTFDNDSVLISQIDLEELGYTVEPVNNCIVIIKNSLVHKTAKCVPQKFEEEETFITQITD